MKKYKIALFTVSIVILIAIIWYANPVLMAQRISQGNIYFMIAALALASCNVFLRTLKWKVLLKDVGLLELIPVQILGMSISNFTPGKVGEPFKALILKARKGINVSEGLTSIIWERIMDLIVLVIFSTFFIAFMSLTFDLLYMGIIAIVIFVSGISVLILILMSKKIGMKIFGFIRKFPVLNRISEQFMEQFYKSTKIQKRRIGASFVITVFCWIIDAAVFKLSFMALGIDIGIFAFAGFIAFSTLVAVASSLPGGIGSFEAVIVVLITTLGVSTVDATTGIMFARFATIWYGTMLGAVSFAYLSKKVDIRAAL